MGWMDALGAVINTAGAIAQANQVNKWLQMDLRSALGEITYLVENYPAEVIDTYEVVLLRASAFLVDPEHKVKLLKLYAGLKMAETERFGFRGFANV